MHYKSDHWVNDKQNNEYSSNIHLIPVQYSYSYYLLYSSISAQHTTTST